MLFEAFFKVKEPLPKVRNGKWKEFNKHAILIAEGNYLDDKKHGDWREYFDSGELMIEETYFHGVQHGRYSSYHKNGVKLSEGNLVFGSREGEFKVYDWNGNHSKSLWFVDNELTKIEVLNCCAVES